MSDEGTVGCAGCGQGLDPHGPDCLAGGGRDDFLGLLALSPSAKLVDLPAPPPTIESLAQLIEELPARQERREEAQRNFILSERQSMIMRQRLGRGPYEGAAYNYVTMDEAKRPRFMRLRRRLFELTIK